MVLATGGGGGAVLGIVDSDQPIQTASSGSITSAELPERVDIGALVVQESPQPEQNTPAPPPAPVQRRVVKVQAPKRAGMSLTVAAPTITAPSSYSGTAVCDRLNDRMIEWLRRLVAKTRDANPGSAAVAAQLDAQLASGLGKNMCAEEAQAYFTAMCADPVVLDFMGKMVRELPFFVRPLVGDPCRHDLIKAAQRYMP
jgi:hypothetical protein